MTAFVLFFFSLLGALFKFIFIIYFYCYFRNFKFSVYSSDFSDFSIFLFIVNFITNLSKFNFYKYSYSYKQKRIGFEPHFITFVAMPCFFVS